MDFLLLLGYLVCGLLVAYYVVSLIWFVIADADLTLLWYEKFGKKAEVLSGQVVWITGASSGIGEYLAYDLARAGCKLVLSARRQEELERVKQQCLVHGGIAEDNILVLPVDLTAYQTHESCVHLVLNKFKHIDVLVNNGGRGMLGITVETDLRVDQEVLNLNYLGVVSLSKCVLPHMLQRKTGHVVVTSSLAGKFGTPFSASYCASKFAVHGWFDTLRMEHFADNISVTVVCPGQVETNITQSMLTEDMSTTSIDMRETPLPPMSTGRCSELMAIAIANKLDEVWITKQPVLGMPYAHQYLPTLFNYIVKNYLAKEGKKQIYKTVWKNRK